MCIRDSPDTIEDKATYSNPKQYTVGVEYVLVNGKIALAGGKQTDVCLLYTSDAADEEDSGKLRGSRIIVKTKVI
ncbi:D-glutamate deacylase [Clostridioides difficile]|nr:D-glutamate deacylase [Clostridioides difficile]